MVARLGYVLYWVCCGVAALFLIGGLFGMGLWVTGYSVDPASSVTAAIVMPLVALVCWALGRAIRYVLAGG
jgi:hypothetical protein